MNEKSRFPENHFQEYRESIGEKIRILREKKGYSQDELAEIMKVHRSTISKIEKGKFAITIDYLIMLAWYLDFEISLIEK